MAHGNPNYFITYGNGKSAARMVKGIRAQWRAQVEQLREAAKVRGRCCAADRWGKIMLVNCSLRVLRMCRGHNS